jgi:Spy/CpxP family protein refolding chaperone
MIRKPLLTLAALTLSGSLAFAQAPAPAPPGPPAPTSAPAGGPGSGRGGMQGRGGGDSYRGSYHGKPGDFHGGSGGFRDGGMGMGASLRIAPPGMWWKSPAIVQKLTLTPDQTRKMDDIFQAARIQLIDLKANVEKQNVMLEPMLSANPPDTVKTLAQIDKVAQARAELEKANAKMLLGIRGVLTPDQWTKLRTGGPGASSASGQPGGGGPGDRGRGPRGSGGGGGNFVAPNQP